MKQKPKELDCRAIASVIANEAFGYNGSDKTNPPMIGLIFAGETLKETVEYALTQQRTELLEEINKEVIGGKRLYTLYFDGSIKTLEVILKEQREKLDNLFKKYER